jgi:drug/metabolite transporter (DMT)-like permease
MRKYSAFLILLLIAFMMGANHVAARLAFDTGLNVTTAVAARSLITAAVLLIIISSQKVSWRLNKQQRRGLPLVGLMIGIQSQCLYSAVSRLPVALALLAFNTFPIWAALWDRVLYKNRPERAVLMAMPVIFLGLLLALDVVGAATSLSLQAHWAQMGAGLGFALVAAASFGLALMLTQRETAGLDGRVRTAGTMLMAGSMALAVMLAQGGPQWPGSSTGWAGLAALVLLYGSAFTLLFTVLPRMGVAGNSAIMNVEPVFALLLAWALLGQSIAPIQMLGAALVVGAVMWLGLRRKAA